VVVLVAIEINVKIKRKIEEHRQDRIEGDQKQLVFVRGGGVQVCRNNFPPIRNETIGI